MCIGNRLFCFLHNKNDLPFGIVYAVSWDWACVRELMPRAAKRKVKIREYFILRVW
jgi:hypothetical protein